MSRKNRKSARSNAAVRRVGRMRLLTCIIVLLFLLLGARLFQLQILQGEAYAQRARSQQTRKVPLESRRGLILDRSGQELAVDLPQFYTLGVYPAQVTEEKTLCQELAAFTGRPVTHYYRRLQSPSKYIYLEWRLTSTQADRLYTMNLGGLNLKKSTGRFYPYHRSMSQLLGYTDVDGRGIAGLEVHCDKVLQGKKGWETHQRNARGVSFWDPLRSYALPKDGGTVRLAVDVVAQEVLHHELQRAQLEYRAQWAGGILLNPRTGEILAMCSVPDFDPLRPEAGTQSHHKLRPVTDLFEPGSVFKVVGAAAVLDRGAISVNDSIYCEEGTYRVANWALRDVHPRGWLSFEDVLVYSSNIGLAKIAEMIGSKELYRYALRFGFGSLSSIEFPGEACGKLHPCDEWKAIDRANIAMGQGISASMLQVALAFAAVANDGILMEPRLILDQTDAEGHHQSFPAREVHRVMEPKTARILQRILAQCIERGTGQNAYIEGLRVAGKTGTAQIPNLIEGGYYRDRFIASFVGFLPAEKADRLLMISICDPQGGHFGSQVAAPVFKRVIERLQPADAMRKLRSASPLDMADMSAGLNKALHLAKANAGPDWQGGLRLSDISPGDSRASRRDDQIFSVVPELKGLSLREAVSLLSQCGINVKIQGVGYVVYQSLSPGSPADGSSVCLLKAKP